MWQYSCQSRRAVKRQTRFSEAYIRSTTSAALYDKSGLFRMVSGQNPVAASLASVEQLSNSSSISVPNGRLTFSSNLSSAGLLPARYHQISSISPIMICSFLVFMSKPRAMAQCSVFGSLVSMRILSGVFFANNANPPLFMRISFMSPFSIVKDTTKTLASQYNFWHSKLCELQLRSASQGRISYPLRRLSQRKEITKC